MIGAMLDEAAESISSLNKLVPKDKIELLIYSGLFKTI